MLFVGSDIVGCPVLATDGLIGTVSDFLFDDRTWKLRWLVVDTGHWLPGRIVLIHPSAIKPAGYGREVPVQLTKRQVEASPDILSDAPVSRQMEHALYGFYGCDPFWGPGSYYGGSSAAMIEAMTTDNARMEDSDPHLRSNNAVIGYGVNATDRAIGHVENILFDDIRWDIRYLIVDTKNWWFGQHVLLSPFTVQRLSWEHETVEVNVSSAQVRGCPPWTPESSVELDYQDRLEEYYGWHAREPA